MPVKSELEWQAERNAEARRRLAELEAADAEHLAAVAARLRSPDERRPGRPRIYTPEEARLRKKEQAREYNRDPINRARANDLRRRNRRQRKAADPAAYERYLEGERRRRNEANRQWRLANPEEHRARLEEQRVKRWRRRGLNPPPPPPGARPAD